MNDVGYPQHEGHPSNVISKNGACEINMSVTDEEDFREHLGNNDLKSIDAGITKT